MEVKKLFFFVLHFFLSTGQSKGEKNSWSFDSIIENNYWYGEIYNFKHWNY